MSSVVMITLPNPERCPLPMEAHVMGAPMHPVPTEAHLFYFSEHCAASSGACTKSDEKMRCEKEFCLKCGLGFHLAVLTPTQLA